MGIVTDWRKQTVYVFDGVVFDGDGRVLIDQRFNDKLESVNGLWEVPGGKLEFGETPEQGIAREIFEETGYKVKVKRVIPYTDVGVLEYPDKTQYTVVFYYLCELEDGEHTEVHDHKIENYEWVSTNNLDSYEFMFGNRTAIEKAVKLRNGEIEESESGFWKV